MSSGSRPDQRQAASAAAPAGAAHEHQRATGPHPADRVLRDGDGQPLVVVEGAERLVAVEFGQGRVVRSGARDHDVVDLGGQPVEEPVEGGRVGDVEGRRAARADLRRGPLEALGVSRGQDDLGTLGASAAGRLEPDAGAAADGHHDLAGQFGFARGDGGGRIGAHDSSFAPRPARPARVATTATIASQAALSRQ
jgi:hypothetical protein